MFPQNGYQIEGGMFKILNNNVIDNTNYFGFGSEMIRMCFKNNLLDYINNVIYNY